MAYVSLAVFVVLVLLAASTGSFFKPGVWYESLNKPSWTPPKWVFPVVWSLLYIMIAIAGWFVWEQVGEGLLIWLWGLQLVLNMAWSWIFFGRRNMVAGLIDILALLIVIGVFIYLVLDVVPMAAYLFIPYFFWVIIACGLNFSIWRLNKDVKVG